MKKTAVVVAPGRGTYNRDELGYLKTWHPDKSDLVADFDDFRARLGQKTISELDGAARFSGPVHTRGDNASPLIYTCAFSDFLSIDRDRVDILAVTGNSMGWYIALACAGALDPLGGLNVVNTMGTLMQETMIGGQLVYPFIDENWQVDPHQHAQILAKVAEIDARPDAFLAVSINLGGLLVLGGNEAGLGAFEAQMPRLQGRFPMRLPNHAAFHTHLQGPIAERGRHILSKGLFGQPNIPLVDGRGGIWQPKACNLDMLHSYTFGHQVTEAYEFTKAIRTAAMEFMPDMFIVLGPGTSLGGATAQSLLLSNWKGMNTKPDFRTAQENDPVLISMGIPDQRRSVL